MVADAGENVSKGNMLILSWEESKLEKLLWNSVWKFLKKMKIHPPPDPAILILGI